MVVVDDVKSRCTLSADRYIICFASGWLCSVLQMILEPTSGKKNLFSSRNFSIKPR